MSAERASLAIVRNVLLIVFGMGIGAGAAVATDHFYPWTTPDENCDKRIQRMAGQCHELIGQVDALLEECLESCPG